MLCTRTIHSLRCPSEPAKVLLSLKYTGQSHRLAYFSTRQAFITPNQPTQPSKRLGRHVRSAISPALSVVTDCTHPSSTIPYSTTTPTAPSDTTPPSAFPRDLKRPTYAPPSTGLLSPLPRSWVPYAELMRLDKPAGTYYLFLPCLFSTLLAATYTHPPFIPLLSTTFLFLTGALIMRGAGCTINDLWDRNLDPHVERTRLRPLARGAVTPFQALAFTGAQLFTGLAILLQFPPACFYYAVPSLVLVSLYPLAKRVTDYPQVVLGLTFSWGAIMGFPALGVDLLTDTAAAGAAAALYASCVAWTVVYDMIYAHMDLKDDRKVGIRSIAVRHERDTKTVLSGMAAVQIGLLATAGAVVGAGPVFFVGSCGGGAAALGWMIWRVRLEDVADCWWWFRNGAWFTGGAISMGLLAEYLLGWKENVVVEKVVGKEELIQGA